MMQRAFIAFALLVGTACSKSGTSDPTDKSAPEKSAAVAPVPSAAAPVASEPKAAQPPPPPRNVLLITIDSLRADMPWAGYSRPIAPNLSKLSESATVYTNAYSASSYTAKSVASFLSGRYPSTLY